MSSGYRSSSEQSNLFETCQSNIQPYGFPVKAPGCSQHEFGLAVDIEARLRPVATPSPTPQSAISNFILCILFNQLPFCEPGLPAISLLNAQRELGAMGQAIGLNWSESDPVHFSAFPSSTFNNHMRSLGADCRVCTFPAGRPF